MSSWAGRSKSAPRPETTLRDEKTKPAPDLVEMAIGQHDPDGVTVRIDCVWQAMPRERGAAVDGDGGGLLRRRDV